MLATFDCSGHRLVDDRRALALGPGLRVCLQAASSIVEDFLNESFSFRMQILAILKSALHRTI